MTTRIALLVLVFVALAGAQTAPQNKPNTPPSGSSQPAAAQPGTSDDDVMIDMSGGEPIPTAPDPKEKRIVMVKAEPETGPKTVRWNPPKTMDASQARMGRIITARGVKLIVSLADFPQYDFTRVNIDVVNGSDKPVAIDPAQVKLAAVAPHEKVLKHLDPNKLAQAIELNDYFNNQADVLHGGGAQTNAGMGVNREVSQGLGATITYEGKEYKFTEFLRKTELRKGDLEASKRAVGGVYFDLDKSRKEALLVIPIGEVTFEIPFEGLIK